MSAVNVTLDQGDALRAGQTMRTLAELGRCGPPEVADLFARVGAQLVAASKVGITLVPTETTITQDHA